MFEEFLLHFENADRKCIIFDTFSCLVNDLKIDNLPKHEVTADTFKAAMHRLV